MLALLVLYIGFKYFNTQSIGGLFSPEMAMEPWSIDKFFDLLKHLPLPAIIIGMAGMAEVVRIMRANLLDELRKPYVVTARAKGLSENRVIMKYPVRAAMNPFASTVGYLIPFLVSGSIIVSLVEVFYDAFIKAPLMALSAAWGVVYSALLSWNIAAPMAWSISTLLFVAVGVVIIWLLVTALDWVM